MNKSSFLEIGHSADVKNWTLQLTRDIDNDIRGRLADDGFSFPDWKSFHSCLESIRPYIFDFFCIHGNLIYINSPRYKVYELVTRNFDPRKLWSSVVVERANVHNNLYSFCRGDSFDIAYARFRACVADMLENF